MSITAFRNAPVTLACLGIVVSSSTFMSSMLLPRMLSHSRTALGSFLCWPLSTFPFVPIGSSEWTFACLLIVVFHFRHLERRWGSSRFMAYVLIMSLFGRITAQALIPGHSQGDEASRLANLISCIVPLVTLTTRYHTDLPSLGKTHVWDNVYVSEKLLVWACVAKVVLAPLVAHYVESVSARGNVVHVPVTAVAFYWRLIVAMASCGIALTTTSNQRLPGGRLTKAIDLLSRAVCSPILRALKMVRVMPSSICGEASRVVHRAPPAAPQPRGGGRPPGGNSRTAARRVGALVAHDDDDDGGIPPEIMDQILREQQEAAAPANAPAAAREGGAAAFPAQDIELLEGLQLGASRLDIIQALTVCNGDVNNAAAFLMEGHHR